MSILNRFNLNGKVALVTGGAGFLGSRICKGLNEAGASVAVVDIDFNNEVKSLVESFNDAGIFKCNVSKKESVVSCVNAVVERFGKIDILFNNAATKTSNLNDFFSSFEDYSLDTWKEVMSVNIDGMFLMAQAVGPHMISSGGGAIIQTSSIYGVNAPDQRIYKGSEYLGLEINTPAVYSASKSAVIGFTKWLATYWAKDSIRVNCLVPGGISSGQNDIFTSAYSDRVPLGRMADVDEIIPAALYLASEASTYVTGQVMEIDGGISAW